MSFYNPIKIDDSTIHAAMAGHEEQMDSILKVYDPYIRACATMPIIDINGMKRDILNEELYTHIQQTVRIFTVKFEYRGSKT